MNHRRVPQPTAIEVRGARVHNLRDLDVDVPLHRVVGIAGVSGSGKSSLAMGVLYAEGSRRYVEALSTYTRRRMSQAPRADVDEVVHVPAALALRQRPGVPGVRSTFGTSTELLNVLRLMFSRLGAHLCPNGHRQDPTIDVAAEVPFACPECGEQVRAPGAEQLAFNAEGACPRCEGLGIVRTVDDATLVPDPTKTLDGGAVVPWNMFGFNVQPDIAREFGVRTDVPWQDLAGWEREIVLDGPEEKKHITVTSKKGLHDLDFTFRNARLTVTEELRRADTEKRLGRVSRFLREGVCPDCEGTRLGPTARSPRIAGIDLAAATAMTLEDLIAWTAGIVDPLPQDMRPMATALVDQLHEMADRLTRLGLGYLALDRAGSSLSTGERQRVQLARAVRNRTTGVLYVLDEPSIGLHPSNIDGLLALVGDLLTDGNSVVLVDHDVQVLRAVDHLIEIGPGSGRDGGEVVATGSVEEIAASPVSSLGGFLDGREDVLVRERASGDDVFSRGSLRLRTAPVHTVHALEVEIPRGRLTAVTGVSGSGKTTMVLESLVPALTARLDGSGAPAHVEQLEGEGISRVHRIDATPIGLNVRSTVATYSGVMDDLRRAFARTEDARERDLRLGDFSYNTGSLRCPRCDGTGQVSLDVQFLPDIDIDCPECDGTRYAPGADEITRPRADGPAGISLPHLMTLTTREALEVAGDIPAVRRRLQALVDLGLGYLTLGEDTPALSGGEAQRLKLAGQIDRRQDEALFVFDEPSVGLHPLDVRTLLDVLDRLVDHGATVIVIEHDLDMIANADHVIDMGPGGGVDGGRIVATGAPGRLATEDAGVTGRYLRAHLG
ncbi:excinuclease ABC subunit A [Brachybacterium sp. P6-10-X1]|uniref:ATP-binding cassette domain-containing protein n=1 Tax=Brachybacterium sp. P6-10-X1 TaxID=1903186 RepID=UPI0009718078|nr:ATP-binding cassette domain-containing protein [Brachybacterium sp. P6-10-X1]APX34179.1 excinuclease ABC subunit A [Brachybacterium sp. P6-10-X1]